jgi:hypothetical protein
VDAVELHTKSKGKDCCWSDDFLGEEIVRNGKSLDVDFDDGAGTCEFEYRISKRTGQSWVSQIDVCHGQTDKRPVITLLKEQP